MSARSPRAAGIAASIIALHFLLVLHGASRHSAVFDEIVYAPSGYAYLTTGDYRMNAEHPPLLKLLTGATWIGRGTDVRRMPGWVERDQWAFGQAMFYGEARPHRELLLLARGAVALLSVLLAGGIFFAARAFAGDAAGLAAVTLYAFDPLVVAHAGLATTDLGGAAFLFLAALASAQAIARGGRFRIAAAGVLAGLAMAAKFSNLIVVPLVAAFATVAVFTTSERPARLAARVAVLLAVAAAVLAATYGPAGPAPFFDGLDALRFHAAEGHPTYAFGRYAERGWWWYFPAAWLVKTPVPILAASLCGIAAAARRLRTDPLTAGPLLAVPAFVAAPALVGSLDLGVRHLLPIVPFLAVAGGSAAAAIWRLGRAGRIAVALAGIWLAAGVLRVHPEEIAYANEPSGGPERLWTRLADSNVDWGQSLPQLAETVRRQPLRRLYLGYFGTADPRAYGLPYTWIPGMRMIERRFDAGEDPGGREWIALSVTQLLGVYSENKNGWEWLRQRPMTAFPGHSIAVWEVTGDAAALSRLGRTALEAGDPEAAIEPLRRAAELAPGDAVTRADLARALGALGRP